MASVTNHASLEAALREAIIEFAANSVAIQAPGAELIDRIARTLHEAPGVRLRIEGHADADGTERDNLEISHARAGAVVGALMARGLPARRFVSIGHGGRKPVDTNATAAGRRANRRVVLSLADD